jgi:hypothetical protein
MGSCRQTLGVAVAISFAVLAACGQAKTESTSALDPETPAPPPTDQRPTPTPTTDPPPPPITRPESRSPQPAPRLLAPLSTSISTSTRPMFSWVPDFLTPNPTVEICRDRACTDVIVSFTATGSSAQPPEPLPPGVVFWRVASAPSNGRTSAVWELTIPARESGRSGSWGSVPDFNGDGFGDLAVGVKRASPELRIFPGGPLGVATTPAQTFSGPMGFADEAGSAGDLDGDGFADLAVWIGGPPARVTVYRGGPQGLSSPVTFPGPEADPFSQMRVVSAGDVNNDGYGDLLVGGRAAAHLFLGSRGGVTTTPAATLAPPMFPGAPVDARWPIGNADFNGDGHPDAIISGTQGGGLLYNGDGQTLIAHPEVPLPLGFGAVAGDFNGDGFADLAAYEITTGGPDGPTTHFQAIAGAYFYQGVGDVNADGFSDALCTVSSVFGVLEADRVYFGGTTPCTSTACPTFVPLFVPGHLNDGSGLAAVGAKGLGDVNGDGYADFAFFSPGAGAVYLFQGSAAGPPSDPSLTITAEAGFGFSVAGM